MKRFLAMLLAVVLVVGVLPMGALAADDHNIITCVEDTSTTAYATTMTVAGATVSKEVIGSTESDKNYTYEVVLASNTEKNATLTMTVAGGIVNPQAMGQARQVTLSYNDQDWGKLLSPTSTPEVTLANGEGTAKFTVGGTVNHTFHFSIGAEPSVGLADEVKLGQAVTVAKTNMDNVTVSSYEWFRVEGETETKINGATEDSYTPVKADYGCQLKVKVTLEGGSVLTATSGTVTFKTDISEVQVTATVTAADSNAAVILRDSAGKTIGSGTGSATGTVTVREDYEYYIYKKGYFSAVGEVRSTGEDVTISGVTLAVCGIQDKDVWASFRGNASNMAIVSTETPKVSNAWEKWSYKSTAAPYVTPPMLMGDSIVVAYGTQIEKVNKKTGKLEAKGTMQAGSSFTQQPPAYGDGRIYFAQMSGRMEAFDAKTLKSLWKYTNKGGGQDSAPVLYADGYVYTGYWSGDKSEYVCLNAATGEEVWTKNVPGGFYWAGPVIVGNAIIVGSCAGTVCAWNKLTGEEISKVEAEKNISSTMAYSAEKGRIYFTTSTDPSMTDPNPEACYLCSVAVDASSGAISDLKRVSLKDYGTTSSCTPVVYGDYVYANCHSNGNTGKFLVAKTDTLEVVSATDLPMTKTSPLVSTAYLAEEGLLYFYTVDYNQTPGNITLTKVKAANPIAEDGVQVETLLTPSSRQFAMNSILCDSDGTLYFKNDGGYVFAVEANGSRLTKLEADVGQFDKALTPDLNKYELVVPRGTQNVKLTLAASTGSAITVGGSSVTDGTYTATLENGKVTVKVTVAKGSASAEYTLNIREISNDTSLAVLTTTGNGITNNPKEISAQSGDDSFYVVTGATTSTRLWLGAKDSKATISKPEELSQGLSFTKLSSANADNNGVTYPWRLLSSGALPRVAKVTVTAEDGSTKEHTVMMVAKDSYDSTMVCYKLTLSRNTLSLAKAGDTSALSVTEKKYLGDSEPSVTWSSNNVAVATVDQTGKVTATGTGTATITASCGGVEIDCAITVGATAEIRMSYSGADGAFVKGADNTVLYEKTVTVIDLNADGKFTIGEAFSALHNTYCAEGLRGYEVSGGSITKFWNTSTSAVGYMLNDKSLDSTKNYLSLDTTLGRGDQVNVFQYGDTTTYSDVYTYFENRTAEAVQKVGKTFTVKAQSVMTNGEVSAPVGATVKVYISNNGSEQKALATTVDENGQFTVTFPGTTSYYVEISGKATYTVNGTTYTDAPVVPSRCAVTVSKADSGNTGSGTTEDNSISVKFRLIGSTLSEDGVDIGNGVDDAKYVTWIKTRTYKMEKGDTAFDLFTKALDQAGLKYTISGSSWISGIRAPSAAGGYMLKDYDNGTFSGWMFTVNGKHVQNLLDGQVLKNGDSVIVHYVNDYRYEDSQWAGGSQGDASVWDRWLKAADVDPTTSSTGGSIGGATAGSTESIEDTVTTVNPPATANKNGEATANLGSGTMKDAISDAKNDGSSAIVIEPEIKGDANKVTVNVPVSSAASVGKDAGADLTLKTDVGTITLPAEELKNLSGGGNLTISAEAKKDENGKTTGEVEVNITKGGEDVEMKNVSVTVPAESGKTNTVLAIVHEDGTEEILKKSAVTENGVTGLVDGSCTVKAVEKSSDFGDTANHWAKDAAEFVANREIFKGTGEKEFSPDLPMNRAMVATVLHRLENAPKANGQTNYTDKLDVWAEEGIAWATENEIVTGYAGQFNGDRPVTRQELATMLYRYAKVLGLSTDGKGDLSKFADGASTADWAKEAMAWAVDAQLFTGRTATTLDPTGTATRAEVAVVTERLVKLMVK